MPGKPVFAEQVEQFAVVVDTLLRNPKTREQFQKDPVGTLRGCGIEFKDAAMAKTVEAEVTAAFKDGASWWDDPYSNLRARAYCRTITVKVSTMTEVVKDPGQYVINPERVNAFTAQLDREALATNLEHQAAILRGKVKR